MELATSRPEEMDDQDENEAKTARRMIEEPLNEKNQENPDSINHQD
jgi:hypothetical protein